MSIQVYERDGVMFQWERLEEIDTCLWKASVSIEDACHRIAGELLICHVIRNGTGHYEWRLAIKEPEEKRFPPGTTEGQLAVDVNEFLGIAEGRTVQVIKEELRAQHNNTRKLLDQQQLQVQRADRIGELLQLRAQNNAP